MNTDMMNKKNSTRSECIFDEAEISALKKDITIIAERNISRSQAKNVMLSSQKYCHSLVEWRVKTVPAAAAKFSLLINEVYDSLGLP